MVASSAARRGGPSSSAKVCTSVPQPVQLLNVDTLEGLMDLVDEDLHDKEAHERVKEDAQLDDQRDAVGAKDREQGEAVLQHEKAHHLGQRLFAADHHEQAHQDQPHRQRHANSRRQPAERHQRPSDRVPEQYEKTGHHQRGGGVHVGLELPLSREAPLHTLQEPGNHDPLEQQQTDRNPVELGNLPKVGHDYGHGRQDDGLPREGAEIGGDTAPPEEDEAEDQDQARAEDAELGEGGTHGLPQQERGRDREQGHHEGDAQQFGHPEQAELGYVCYWYGDHRGEDHELDEQTRDRQSERACSQACRNPPRHEQVAEQRE